MRSTLRLLALAALAGCVVSVDAIVPRSSTDARLVGSWTSTDADSVVITAFKDSGYAIAYTADGKTGHFRATLGRLGPRTVLDVWPAPRDSEIPEPYVETLIPGHYLLALDIAADTIRSRALNTDTLRAALQSRTLTLSYSATRKRIVLLDTTGALRARLGAYLARPGALEGPTTWHRAGSPR